MTQTMDQIMNALLLGVSYAFLLLSFVPVEKRIPKWRKWAAAIVAALLFSGIQRLGQSYYLHALLTYLIASGTLLLWTGWHWAAAMQRALGWYLTMESATMLFAHLSMKLAGADVFRSGPMWRMAVATLGMTALLLGLLRLLRLAYPQTVLATGRTLLLCLLATLPYLFVRQINLWLPVRVEQVSPAVVATGVFSAVAALLLATSLERLLAAEKEKRTALARQIEVERQQQQYMLRKHDVDIVRQQYHDMKNLLLYLEKAPARENIHAHVGEMLDAIRPFESILDTGNDVVDILLGEKLEVCRRMNILCTVMVDGERLGFIDQLDLVTILGNAMDNAIEACRQVEESRRTIQVRTSVTPGFVVLHIHNSCLESVRVQGELPRTTKADAENHGFGLRNIRRTLEKYQGVMRCEAQAGEFEFTLLFPV